MTTKKNPPPAHTQEQKPVICIGHHTINQLMAGETVEIDAAIMIPASDLTNGPASPAQTQPVEAQGEAFRWMWEEDLINSGTWSEQYDDERPREHPQVRNIRPLYAAPQPAAAMRDSELVERVYHAVSYCPHDINAERVVLRYDQKAEGHNALNQLHRRITAAFHGPEQGEA